MAEIPPEEIRALLNRKQRWVALTSIGPSGYPHTVPIGYFLVGDDLVMGSMDCTQKVKNIERNPRVSVMWENGRGKESIQGILIQGQARIVRNPQERMELKREACRQRGDEPPSTLPSETVYIVVTPMKTRSWDRPRRAGS